DLDGLEQNLRGDLARARQASDEGRLGAMWERIALDDGNVQRGLAAGSLVTDLRLRNAFRRIRETGDAPVADGDARTFDGAVFSEAEVVRRRRWVDEIERRVSLLEHRPGAQVR